MLLIKEQTNRSVEKNREPQIDPHKYSQLIFDKGAKVIQRSKKSFHQKVLEEQALIHTHTHKKKSLDTELTPLSKINSKWITDLNVKYETIKHSEDNRRKPQ